MSLNCPLLNLDNLEWCKIPFFDWTHAYWTLSWLIYFCFTAWDNLRGKKEMNIALEALKCSYWLFTRSRSDNDKVPLRHTIGFPWKGRRLLEAVGWRNISTIISWKKPSAIIWIGAEVNIITQVRSPLRHFSHIPLSVSVHSLRQ